MDFSALMESSPPMTVPRPVTCRMLSVRIIARTAVRFLGIVVMVSEMVSSSELTRLLGTPRKFRATNSVMSMMVVTTYMVTFRTPEMRATLPRSGALLLLARDSTLVTPLIRAPTLALAMTVWLAFRAMDALPKTTPAWLFSVPVELSALGPPFIGMDLLARSVLVTCSDVVVNRCLLVEMALFLLSIMTLLGIMLVAPTRMTPLLCSMEARGVATRVSVLIVRLVWVLRTQFSIVPMTRTRTTMTVLNGSILLVALRECLTNYVTSETIAVVSSRHISGLRNRVRNPPYPGMGGVSVNRPGLNPLNWCRVLVESRLAPALILSVPVILPVLAKSGLMLRSRFLRDRMFADRLPARLITTALPTQLWSS